MYVAFEYENVLRSILYSIFGILFIICLKKNEKRVEQQTGKPNQTTTTTTTQQQTNYFKIPGIILGTVLYYNKPKK